jgi:hypothetical protein
MSKRLKGRARDGRDSYANRFILRRFTQLLFNSIVVADS